MAKLIILRGNSGSGKTTTAKRLQERIGTGTMRLSHDMIRMEILHTHGRDGVERSLPLMIELLRYGRRHVEVTILEGILHTADYAPLFQTAIEEFGTEIYAYYYNLPFEETLRRHETKPNHGDFGEVEMRRWWRDQDLIGTISETILGMEDGQEETVEKILRDIGSI